MARVLHDSRPVAGGWTVRVELTRAFTDGSSRFAEVFVPAAAMEGDLAARLAAVRSALGDPFEDLRRRDVDTGEISRSAVDGTIGG